MKRLLPALMLVIVLAFLAACSIQSAASPTPTPAASPTPTASPTPPATLEPVPTITITVQEVKEKLDRGLKLVLIDLRGQNQFAAGHLQGARDIPEPELAGRPLDFPLDSEVIVYASCA